MSRDNTETIKLLRKLTNDEYAQKLYSEYNAMLRDKDKDLSGFAYVAHNVLDKEISSFKLSKEYVWKGVNLCGLWVDKVWLDKRGDLHLAPMRHLDILKIQIDYSCFLQLNENVSETQLMRHVFHEMFAKLALLITN